MSDGRNRFQTVTVSNVYILQYVPDGSNLVVLSYVEDLVYWNTSEEIGHWFVDTLDKISHVNLTGYANFCIYIRTSQLKDNYISVNQDRYVNSRVPKTVRHGTSLHRICPKLLIDSIPSRLESQTSVRQPTAKLFGSSPI